MCWSIFRNPKKKDYLFFLTDEGSSFEAAETAEVDSEEEAETAGAVSVVEEATEAVEMSPWGSVVLPF